MDDPEEFDSTHFLIEFLSDLDLTGSNNKIYFTTEFRVIKNKDE